jgi:uncharacterized protein (DUF2147 family)
MWHYVGLMVAAHATDFAAGAWMTQDKKAIVRMAPCVTDTTHLCGTIEQILSVEDKAGLDNYNPDPKLRRLPVLGLTILTGFSPATARDAKCPWQDGKAYDPDSGKTYTGIELCEKDADHMVLTKELRLGPLKTGVAGETWARVHK